MMHIDWDMTEWGAGVAQITMRELNFYLVSICHRRAGDCEEVLVDFAKKIGKPDQKVYVSSGKWKVDREEMDWKPSEDN